MFRMMSFVELWELLLGRVGFAVVVYDDGVSEHVDDVFSEFGADEFEIGLQDQTIVVFFKQPFFLFAAELEA